MRAICTLGYRKKHPFIEGQARPLLTLSPEPTFLLNLGSGADSSHLIFLSLKYQNHFFLFLLQILPPQVLTLWTRREESSSERPQLGMAQMLIFFFQAEFRPYSFFSDISFSPSTIFTSISSTFSSSKRTESGLSTPEQRWNSSFS